MALNVAAESKDHAAHYWDKGYAIVRGLFTKAEMAEIQTEAARIYAEGLKHHASYRHKNLYYEILPEAYSGKRHMLQAHWFSWISPLFEKLRRGTYQDLMTAWINTGLAIDPATRENGCLRVISGSHKKGYLGLSDDGPIMKGTTQDEELKKAGLDLNDIVDVELEPGDLAIWGLLTVHGSDANKSAKDRAFAISGYVKAENSDRGEWAFRDGVSVPLGAEPEICKYEKLREKPGPFYEDSKWYAA